MKDAKVIELEEGAIRFSGDSGDGMQLTGPKSGHRKALLVVYPGFRFSSGKRKLPLPAIWLTYWLQ